MRYTLSILRPAPIRKRLWQGGVGLLLLLGTLAVGNFFISPDRAVNSRMLGHDFLAFYTAGNLTRMGQFDQLYNLGAIREMEHAVARDADLEIGKSFGPYWNPPVYAWALAPLSAMPYRTALTTWTALNLGFLAVAVYLMARMLPAAVSKAPRMSWAFDEPWQEGIRPDWRAWALIPLLILTSMPFIHAISHGQNTFASLMILCIVVTAWRKNMPVMAGIACGFLFYKPQLAAVVAGMLVLSMGMRVSLGLAFMAGMLALVMGFTMPESINQYLEALPAILRCMQVDNDYLWERHVTLKAFWRMLFQGRGAGDTSLITTALTIASAGTIGIGLLGAWWRSRHAGVDDCWTGETRSVVRDRLIGATITSMPLLMPFYFDYDLLLLSIPAVLYASELASRAPGARLERRQKLLLGLWVALFAWMFVNIPVAGASGVNVSAILLTSISIVTITRAIDRGVKTTTLKLPTVYRVEARRAA
jgi:hypothetical protein